MCSGANASMRSIERRRASGWNCTGVVVGMIQGPARGVELAVRQAEGVAGEEAPAALVPDAVVVHRVAGRVEEDERPAGELERHAVGGLRRRDRRRPATSVPYERSISSAP